jgi:hypothetical protein
MDFEMRSSLSDYVNRSLAHAYGGEQPVCHCRKRSDCLIPVGLSSQASVNNCLTGSYAPPPGEMHHHALFPFSPGNALLIKLTRCGEAGKVN